MLEFMDYVQHAFSRASGWDRNNSYGALTATARCTPPTLPSHPCTTFPAFHSTLPAPAPS